MLTTIRQSQKWVLIFVCAIIVISFSVYTGFDGGRSQGAADTAFCIYGKCYGEKEAIRIARHYGVARSLGFGGFAESLFGEDRLDDDRTDFVMSLLILRKEAEKMGVSPTTEEIAQGWRELPIFSYSPNIDGKWIKDNITGPAGFTKVDEMQLMKDYLSWKQIRELLDAGIVTSDDEVDRIYKQRNRQFSTRVISFDRAKYLAEAEVTDEEVQSYFDDHQGELLTEEARAFDYVHIGMPELPADASNEAKADARSDYLKKTEQVYLAAIEDSVDFAVAAKELGVEVLSAGPMPLSGPAAELATATPLLSAVFAPTVTESKPVPVPVKEDSADPNTAYYIVKLKEIVAPREQTLEEAYVEIVATLKAQKADRAVEEAAQTAQSTITEALTAGKPFDEAISAAGVEAKEVPQFSQSVPPTGVEDAGQILQAVSSLDAGDLSGVIAGSTGNLLVYVDQIVLFENENEEAERKSIAQLSKTRATTRVFNAWFRKVKSESEAFRRKSVEDIQRRADFEAQQRAAEEAPTEA